MGALPKGRPSTAATACGRFGGCVMAADAAVTAAVVAAVAAAAAAAGDADGFGGCAGRRDENTAAGMADAAVTVGVDEMAAAVMAIVTAVPVRTAGVPAVVRRGVTPIGEWDERAAGGAMDRGGAAVEASSPVGGMAASPGVQGGGGVA